MPPTVSVVMPFLNAERFMREAIEGVLGQTYGDLELLLVDDGASDGSLALAREYAAREPARVRCLAHPARQNRGISASRNLGLRHAAGEFFAAADADDRWLPEKLEHQVALMRAHPDVGMVYGCSLWWYGWTGRAEDLARDHVKPLGIPGGTVVRPPDLLTHFLRRDAIVPCTNSLLVRRAVVERVGGFEDDFRGAYEDQVFYAKVALDSPVLVDDACLDWYRQHPDSCSATGGRRGQRRSARATYLRWLAAYVAARGVRDRALRRALTAAAWECAHPTLTRIVRRAGRVLRSG